MSAQKINLHASNIKSLLLEEIEPIILDLNEPAFRAKQLFLGLHKENVLKIDEITTLKKPLRDTLAGIYQLQNISLKSVKVSKDGTRKYAFSTHDGHTIESVFIPHAAKEGRHSICISSQVGCAMGCTFCATAALKLKRNLNSSEIISQVYLVSKDVLLNGDREFLHLEDQQKPIHNIVFMGMGEPLHNLENVIRAIELLTHPLGMAFSARRITVSTSGLVNKIKELGSRTSVYLAISLNATTDIVRNEIMPVNRRWPIEELIKAARDFPLKIRERITFEYVLLKGINDSFEDAHRLSELMMGLKCKINLIPFNEHPLSPFKKPDRETVLAFHQILISKNLSVFTRKTRGDDIDAACGMLGAEKLVAVRNISQSFNT